LSYTYDAGPSTYDGPSSYCYEDDDWLLDDDDGDQRAWSHSLDDVQMFEVGQ
jgi:hypothetical protein